MILTPQHPIFTANDFFRQKFGEKIIKISIDGGFTCPNRDGTKSTMGCIFCSASGSGDFAGNRSKSIAQQIADGKAQLGEKWKNGKYMAYFQAFTNTYAPPEQLKSLYYQAISQPDVVALSVATRPDCVDENVVELLTEISKTHYVTVELGMQTANEKTADFINRQFGNSDYETAVKLLNSANIDVITHIILGLPDETRQDMQNSVDFAIKCGTRGIKLQLLHVLKGTRLGGIYTKKPFKTFEQAEYISLVTDIIETLPQDIVVHRITGDAPKPLLIEPWWSLNKRSVLNGISKEFAARRSYQGYALVQDKPLE